MGGQGGQRFAGPGGQLPGQPNPGQVPGTGVAPGAPGAPGAQQPGTAGTMASAAAPGARQDPFKPWWPPPPPPPAITLVSPIRIARMDVTQPPTETIRIQEVPDRRVSGILTGSGVMALLEGPEGPQVVRPGDMVGEYRVEQIESTSVTLKRKVGNQEFTQVVPLTDAGSTTRPATGGGAPGGAMGPGGVPGLPGLPGAGGRGRRLPGVGGALGGGKGADEL